MRLVQVLIPEGNREAALEALDAEGIDYAMWDETGRGDFEALVSFPVPEGGVEPVLGRLRAAGVRPDAYTIVMQPETVVSERLDALRGRYSARRISREELLARAEDLAPETDTYAVFLLLSTIIATAGLLTNSAATIIGAMVIAPLMGPALAVGVGTVTDETDLVSRGILLQVVGLGLAVLTAAAFGLLLKHSILVPPGLDIETIPQVQERLSPSLLSIVLALGSGVAGAFSLVREAGSSLVGVAIAVALIPPAATAGLGIAWLDPVAVVAAGTLVLVNLLSVNLSGLVVLWLAGYRPAESDRIETARAALFSRITTILVLFAVLSVVVLAVTIGTYQTSLFEQQTTDEVERFFDGDEFDAYHVQDVHVAYETHELLLDEPAGVTVIVLAESDDSPPDLAERIRRHIRDETGADVHVDVAFVDAQEAR
ncbi:TIGR00341 family protein [Haloferacaceae archaeon DSL9]